MAREDLQSMVNETVEAAQAALTVVVEIRDIFGKRKAYPANDKAELLAKIAGTTTLTTRTIELARDLGLTVREKYGRDFWPQD